jgi:hypothetical protein
MKNGNERNSIAFLKYLQTLSLAATGTLFFRNSLSNIVSRFGDLRYLCKNDFL